MKNKTKMFISMCGLFIFGALYQTIIGNTGALIVGGILLFGIGFGWYGCKAQQNETSTFKSNKKLGMDILPSQEEVNKSYNKLKEKLK